MALTTEDRQRIQRGLMRHWSGIREATNGFDKADLLAAVTATDTWIEANQAGFNQALPAKFRNGATLTQKTLLFCAVALARVSLEFLRRIFGGVD